MQLRYFSLSAGILVVLFAFVSGYRDRVPSQVATSQVLLASGGWLLSLIAIAHSRRKPKLLRKES